MKFEENLREKGLSIPVRKGAKPFESGVVTGNLLYISGHAAKIDGVLKYKGIVGDNVTLDEAKDAANICFLNCLSAVAEQVGSIEKIKKIVNIKGYVACVSDFTQHGDVMNEVTSLANEVFEENGKHSRISFGVSSLPEGTPVEVEIIVEV